MLNDAAKSSVVSDRELEEGKSHDSSGPRIRCPLCGWSPRKDDLWACDCGHLWNTFDTGGVCHGMPPPVDFYTMPFLYPLVAAYEPRVLTTARPTRLCAQDFVCMSALNWVEERLVWPCLGRFELGSGVECFLVLPPSDRTPRAHPKISRARSIKTLALNQAVQSPGATMNTLFPDACRKCS